MEDPFKKIDQDLLLKQKEDLYGAFISKDHKIKLETLEGVLNLLDAITDNAETINSTELCECGNCGYKGNTAIWDGKATTDEGEEILIKGAVKLVDGTFELDDLLEEATDSEIDSFDGDYNCPFCESNDIY